ncbi:MAG: PTS system mannose/fructose/sorbose family transporter subunit IID [Bradymonadia bacterium]
MSKTLTRTTYLRTLWRSFFFQAATNYERMQNLGFAFCMMPALTRLYAGDALKQAMARHLEFFNSHPYMADALVGASVRLEVEIAEGRAVPQRVQQFKSCTMGPLAAIGDAFFWASLKPMAAAIAVAGVLAGLQWAPVIFLLVYNVFHLGLRVYGLWAGFHEGENVIQKINQVALVRFAEYSHYIAALCLGIGAAMLASGAIGAGGASHVITGFTFGPLLLSVLVLIFMLCIRRKIPTLALLYGGAGLTVGVIVLLNTVFPLL